MDWQQKDKEYVWHPFTQMQEYTDEDPVVIERAEGVYLEDTEGNTYYDGVSSLWLNVHGHRVEAIDEAVRDQLEKVAHTTLLGRGSVPSIALAERLVEVAPEGLSRVFYSDSGATAVEIGMKMAIQFFANQSGRTTPRQRFLTFENGYHGDTFGPMSAVPDPTFHWPFEPLLPDPVQVPFPHVKRWPGAGDPAAVLRDCLDRVEGSLEEHAESIAAVMVEPVQGAGGMITAPDGFLGGLRELTREHGCFLIVDEVATGFGRTGPMFACDAAGITPDILPLGKGLTGGYLPVAATLATDRLYEAFLGRREDKTALYHGHSYTGNALGCAAALASLDRLEACLDELPAKIERIAQGLAPLEEQPHVYEVRQEGFMCGVELMRDPEEGEPFPEEARAGWTVCERARERGMLIRPLGDVVVFMPPLGSTEEELEAMLEVLRGAVEEAREPLPGA